MALARRPFVAVNIAMTADGKIAPDSRRFTPFSSKEDRTRMMLLRSRVDAVMSGAATVADGKVDLGPGGRKFQQMRIENGLAESNLRVIVSRSGSISERAHIFRTRFSPILVLTTEAAGDRLKKLGKVVDDMFVSPGSQLDLAVALRWLRERWQVKRLLCEGGGELNGAMFAARLVDELYLTICPLIFGGRAAPTLADGDGIEHLADAVPLRRRRIERLGDELFCVFRVS